jgi:hypothetical protein
MHTHKYQGQTLRHDHPGSELPHGYFEHAEDVLVPTVENYAAVSSIPELQSTGEAGCVSTAEDYARYAAAAMNAATADDTEFIADGATVTAYVHCLAHMSATFTLDLDRPCPGDES